MNNVKEYEDIFNNNGITDADKQNALLDYLYALAKIGVEKSKNSLIYE